MIKNVEEHVDMMMIIHQTEKEHLHLPTIISRHTVYFAAMIGKLGHVFLNYKNVDLHPF